MPQTRQIQRLSLDGPTYQDLARGETIEWHDHDVDQLIYPSAGLVTISTTAGSWLVPPQRAVWIPAGVPHAHLAHGAAQLRTLTFPAGDGLDEVTVLGVSLLLREVIVALTDPGIPASQRADLERVALAQLHRVGQLPLRLPALDDDRLRAIAALLLADPADQRTLAGFGACVGASERTLSRLFRREAGMSFPQWRIQLRLRHALILLAEGEPVTTVALACGWSNPSAFIETFRRSFGTTPARFFTR